MKEPVIWICREQMMRGEGGSVVMDYSAAHQYGKDIRFITKTDMPQARFAPQAMDDWKRDVTMFVQEYNELTDYIIVTGSPASIFAIGQALGEMGKVPRFLVWRREDNHYRILDGTSFDEVRMARMLADA